MEEIKQLKANGVKTVMLNGWKEDIDYVVKLTNIKRIDTGWYETI